VLQKHLHCENEATCLLAAVLVDGPAKDNYSQYFSYTAMQSIIVVRNDDRIIDVRLTTIMRCEIYHAVPGLMDSWTCRAVGGHATTHSAMHGLLTNGALCSVCVLHAV